MKNLKYTTIFFFFVLFACKEETPQLPEKVVISTEKELILSHLSMKTLSPRKKITKNALNQNIDFSAYLQNSDNLIPPPFAMQNSVIAVEKGCAKIKKIINKYPADGYDETATVTYRAINLIDYIDYEYSDDPSYNGRTKFTYSADGLTLTLSYTYTDGEVRADKDIIKLNAKGYAVEWLHDFSNFKYEKPYTEKIEYNAQGFPTRFIEIYQGKTVLDDVVKYTKEINFETITDLISGDVASYTYDLSKKSLLAISGGRFWVDFSRLYGENNTNYVTSLVVKDKTGKTTFTVNIDRTFSSDGTPKTITRKEDGKVVVIYDVQSLDCKNYTYSAPRTWR